MSARPRIAMVVQRCGTEVNGGAEAACLSVASEMNAVWDVSILTTCALDHQTWSDHYEPGETTIGGVPVLRFRVDKPRSSFFNGLSAKALRRGSHQTPAELEAWMKAQGPYSSSLLRYIKEHQDEYDAWFFFTYLYATTFFGLPLVADRAVLVPFAHDEWPIHLPGWNAFFEKPRQLVYSTEEERAFVRRRFPDSALQGEVVGVGVRPPLLVREDHFRHRFNIHGPYALYLGRIDTAKGCDVLLRDFAYARDSDLTLVMIGREAMEMPEHSWLRLLGFVDEQTKYEAIRGAEFIVAPAALESLSLVLLEAWSQERPVLVNAASDVMVGQCQRAGGGLWYSDAYEFAAALPLLRNKEIARNLGESGKHYLDEHYGWDVIRAKYERALDNVVAVNTPPGSFSDLGNNIGVVRNRVNDLIFIDTRDQSVGAAVRSYGEWEPHITQTMQRLLNPGDTVIEVGSNIGCHVLTMARSVGATGSVIAIEANPEVAALLRRTVAANRLGNVTVLETAVLDRPRDVELWASPSNLGGGAVGLAGWEDDPNLNDWRRHSTTATTLDVLAAELPAAQLIHMDVEGSELAILAGAELLLARSPHVRIIAEWGAYHAPSYFDIEAGLEFLIARGFHFWQLRPDGTLLRQTKEQMLECNFSDVLIARDDLGES